MIGVSNCRQFAQENPRNGWRTLVWARSEAAHMVDLAPRIQPLIVDLHKIWRTAGFPHFAGSACSSGPLADVQSEEQLIFFCRRAVSAAWSHPTRARRFAPDAASGATKGPKHRLMSAALKSQAFWGSVGRKNSNRLVTHESHTTPASDDLHTAGWGAPPPGA